MGGGGNRTRKGAMADWTAARSDWKVEGGGWGAGVNAGRKAALLHAARAPALLDVLRVAPRVAGGVGHAALADGARDAQAQERIGDVSAVASQGICRRDDRGAGEKILCAEDCVVRAGARNADGGGGSPGACEGVA